MNWIPTKNCITIFRIRLYQRTTIRMTLTDPGLWPPPVNFPAPAQDQRLPSRQVCMQAAGHPAIPQSICTSFSDVFRFYVAFFHCSYCRKMI